MYYVSSQKVGGDHGYLNETELTSHHAQCCELAEKEFNGTRKIGGPELRFYFAYEKSVDRDPFIIPYKVMSRLLTTLYNGIINGSLSTDFL